MKKLISIVLLVLLPALAHSAEFFCASGNVTCLVAAINEANTMPGEHSINLEPGIYSLQTADNGSFGGNGLPVVTGAMQIRGTADDTPTVIERDSAGQGFRIFQISLSGNLSLNGLTIQRAVGSVSGGAILNHGKLSLFDSVVTNNDGESGAINNRGSLNLFRTLVTDNHSIHEAGGILNEIGGTALIEFSTIAHNRADGSGGIFNRGAMIVRNSSIIFNGSFFSGSGGGIGNTGSLEIISSTVARNSLDRGFGDGGGGIFNFSGGVVSITNSTIRENEINQPGWGGFGSGILNSSGTVRLQNTIVAGNTIDRGDNPIGVFRFVGPDCFGTVTSFGTNVFGDLSDCTVNIQPTDRTGDPGLGALVGAGEEDLPGKAYYPVLAGSVVLNSGNAAACPNTDQLGNPRVGKCDIGAIESQDKLLVSVDVRPRSDANRINPNSTKAVNVAVFSNNGFDTAAIDPNTVRYGATGTEAAAIHVARRDVDGDGDRDLVLRFQIADTGITCGDTSALLTGQIAGGAAIIGSSPIQTVQCRQKKPKIAAKLR